MNCFEVVKAVLDVTCPQIAGDDATKNAAISTALSAMSAQYRNLLTAGGPNFADPVTRFAYVYQHVPAHAHWVHELMDWSDEVSQLLRQPKVRVTCLGGGPGSDLVGVLKFISTNDLDTALFCEIVDGCIQWKQTWADLAYSLEWPSSLHTDYVIHDVSAPHSWGAAPCNFAN
jgi:hypothetical protein